jgi:hypothetical protein
MSQGSNYSVPFSRDQHQNGVRRLLGRFGLDFAVFVFRSLTKQIDAALEGVVGATMSSTGFVTFLDLASTTCAASAPLSVDASVLHVTMAPEPRVRRHSSTYSRLQPHPRVIVPLSCSHTHKHCLLFLCRRKSFGRTLTYPRRCSYEEKTW